MSYPHYPAGSEYEYLWWVIQQDYFADDELYVEPLYRAEHQAWNSGSNELYEETHDQRVSAQHRIQQRRWRREELLNWLYLDTQLRQQGSSYPDAYERLGRR